MKRLYRGLRLACAAALALSMHLSLPARAAETAGGSDYDRFFIYRGTYGEAHDPLFEYIAPYGQTAFTHKKVYCPGDLGMELSYGDVLVSEKSVSVRQTQSAYTYTMPEDVSLVYIGRCEDLFEVRTLTVDYLDVTTDLGDPYAFPDPVEYYAIGLSEGEEYSVYRTDEYLSDQSVRLGSTGPGDTVSFAFYRGRPMFPLKTAHTKAYLAGDVDRDGAFAVSDLVRFQNWLLRVPDTCLSDWLAADFSSDGRLDVIDLSLMKRALTQELHKPRSVMTVRTSYSGYGMDGHKLAEGSFTESFTVSQGDAFYETSDGHFLLNAVHPYAYEGKVGEVTALDASSITLSLEGYDGTQEVTLAYGETVEFPSTFVVYDGVNYSYALTFDAP